MDQDPKTSPALINAPAFVLEPARGALAIDVVQALLHAVGRPVDYAALKAVSGDGFKFVYDTVAAFEPLRDLAPLDTIRRALSFCGVQTRWVTDHSRDELAPLLEHALNQGWPAITSSYLSTYQGYQLIVGLDLQAVPRRIAIQRGREDGSDAAVQWVAWDRDWNGPLTGRARWDRNPVLIVESIDEDVDLTPSVLLNAALKTAVRVFEVFDVPFSTANLEGSLTEEPLSGRVASNGLNAWTALIEHAGTSPDTPSFAWLWKLRTLGQQLAFDRASMIPFFRSVRDHVPTEAHALLDTLVTLLRNISAGATDLASRAWDEQTLDADTPDALQDVLSTSRALAFALSPENDRLIDGLRTMGYADRLHTMPWGMALMMFDRTRWRYLVRHADELLQYETTLETTLRRLTDRLA